MAADEEQERISMTIQGLGKKRIESQLKELQEIGVVRGGRRAELLRPAIQARRHQKEFEDEERRKIQGKFAMNRTEDENEFLSGYYKKMYYRMTKEERKEEAERIRAKYLGRSFGEQEFLTRYGTDIQAQTRPPQIQEAQGGGWFGGLF
jgi:hypothetical protein